MDIASRIKILRGKLSQDEFAERVRIHKSSLGRYERRESIPDSEFLSTICSEFAVNPEWLLLGTGPMQSEQEPGEQGTGERKPDEGSSVSGREVACAHCELLKAENRGLKEATASYKEALWVCRQTIEILQRQLKKEDMQGCAD